MWGEWTSTNVEVECQIFPRIAARLKYARQQ